MTTPRSSPRPGPSTDLNDNDELRRSYARLARKLANTQQLLENTQGGSSAKRLITFTTLGRGICRAVTLFDPLALLVREADRREGGEADICEPDDELILNRNRLYKSYQILLDIVPGIHNKLCSPEPDEIDECLKKLEHGSKNACSDDIGHIKASVATWLNGHTGTQPLLDPDDRSNRGLQHDTTGRLLCPIEFNWDDDVIRAKIRAGEEGYDHSNSFFARCFYSGYMGDPNKVSDGFLRSNLLLKVYASLFTSPSSAKRMNENTLQPQAQIGTRSKNATRSDTATRLGLQSVTPRTIAYAALHFSLTDAGTWRAEYNGFSYPALYNFIVDYFEDISSDPNDTARQEAQALLKWWNWRIFPGVAKSTKALNTSKTKLRAQRQKH